jgi:hypothetical protein
MSIALATNYCDDTKMIMQLDGFLFFFPPHELPECPIYRDLLDGKSATNPSFLHIMNNIFQGAWHQISQHFHM